MVAGRGSEPLHGAPDASLHLCVEVAVWGQVKLQTVRRSVWCQGFCPLKAPHDTLACQFTNVPVGLFFHAHTCSV